MEINEELNREKVGKVVEVVCEDYDPVAEIHFGRSTADAPDEDTIIEAKAYGDIAEFQAEINALPTADLKLIVEDQADLYTAEEMAFIRATLARRGKL